MRKIILILFLLLTAKGFCQFEPVPRLTYKDLLSRANTWTATNTFTSPLNVSSSSTNIFSGGVRGLWVEGAGGQYLGLTSKFILTSSTDGSIRFTNYAGNTNATLTFGTATITGLPTYADNTAALAGGLTAGQLYKTSTGVLMVTY